MALVRCSCLSTLTTSSGTLTWAVTVADPECGYAPHRLAQLDSAPEPA